MNGFDETIASDLASGRLIVRYERDPAESVLEAILTAAAAAGISLDTDAPVLNDHVDADGLANVCASDDDGPGGLRAVFLELWERTFLVTPDVIEVYDG